MASLTLALLLLPNENVAGELLSALQQHQAAFAHFSCKVKFTALGHDGLGFYVRTPSSVRIKSEWRGDSLDLLLDDTERKQLLRTGSKCTCTIWPAATWRTTPLLSQADVWNKFLLTVNTPELPLVDLAVALPKLSSAACTIGKTNEGDIEMTLQQPNGYNRYKFARKLGFLPMAGDTELKFGDHSLSIRTRLSEPVEVEPGLFFFSRCECRIQQPNVQANGTRSEILDVMELSDLSLDPGVGARYPAFEVPVGTTVINNITREFATEAGNGKREPVRDASGKVRHFQWAPPEKDESKYLDQRQARQLADASALGPTGFNEPSSWPWVLGGAAVGAIVAVVVWYLRRRWLAAE